MNFSAHTHTQAHTQISETWGRKNGF